MTNVQKAASAVAAAIVAAAWGVITPAVSAADPAGHQVTYTITTTGNLTGTVRYMKSDPPSQAAFDANSSQYMPSVSATFSADQPLVYSATLANPNQWAIVSASGGCHWPDCGSGSTPELHCEIAVDGQVVVTRNATTGVTCSTRPW
ncbi:hypothetical protein F0Q45_16560 [Mycobacterium simiae]|uniref:Uncharacterized protein n=1 Tax=Mycobacterium simiae TaxID=1784 RepID=A0A5B1BKI2_MYCSI|nr:hypothetical protein [Mycobacterium simiae]KAA1249178.1 hypothetical protein F0Q45_16560 [Mycobacterium simiae]